MVSLHMITFMELITDLLTETVHENRQHQRSASRVTNLDRTKVGQVCPYGGQPVLNRHFVRSSLIYCSCSQPEGTEL